MRARKERKMFQFESSLGEVSVDVEHFRIEQQHKII